MSVFEFLLYTSAVLGLPLLLSIGLWALWIVIMVPVNGPGALWLVLPDFLVPKEHRYLVSSESFLCRRMKCPFCGTDRRIRVWFLAYPYWRWHWGPFTDCGKKCAIEREEKKKELENLGL